MSRFFFLGEGGGGNCEPHTAKKGEHRGPVACYHDKPAAEGIRLSSPATHTAGLGSRPPCHKKKHLSFPTES